MHLGFLMHDLYDLAVEDVNGWLVSAVGLFSANMAL
jgi:hypothetical protein